jgi:hypothetical protein
MILMCAGLTPLNPCLLVHILLDICNPGVLFITLAGNTLRGQIHGSHELLVQISDGGCLAAESEKRLGRSFDFVNGTYHIVKLQGSRGCEAKVVHSSS